MRMQAGTEIYLVGLVQDESHEQSWRANFATLDIRSQQDMNASPINEASPNLEPEVHILPDELSFGTFICEMCHRVPTRSILMMSMCCQSWAVHCDIINVEHWLNSCVLPKFTRVDFIKATHE